MEPVHPDYSIPWQSPLQWIKYLQDHGFVVVRGYLTAQESQKFVDELWTVMQTLAENRLDRNKPKTQVLSASYPPTLHGGMIQYLAHSQVQWDLRVRCKPIFEALWKASNLKTSFDGFCFMNGNRNYKPVEINSFLHTDQSPQRHPIWSYQGLINLVENGPQDGGFVVVPDSHLYHEEYFKKHELTHHKDDWYLFPEEHKLTDPVLKRCLKVNAGAGDFILWDSRTFHCNTVPKTKGATRICTYICMLPEKKVSEDIKVKRRKAADTFRTSTHHPGSGFRLFPVLPRFVTNRDHFQKVVEKVNTFKMTQEINSLI